jgi:hypothetical protein
LKCGYKYNDKKVFIWKMHLQTDTQARERAMSKWTVWVGGSEINWQHYTHKIDAERVAEFWREVKGYDDVIVEEVA